MPRLPLTTLILGLVLSTSSAVTAAEKITDLIPAEITYVVNIRWGRELARKEADLIRRAKLPQEIDSTRPVGDRLDAGHKRALPLTKSLCIVGLPNEARKLARDRSVEAWLMISDQEKELQQVLKTREAFGEKLELFRHGNYLVACQSVRVRQAFENLWTGKSRSLTQQMSATERDCFERGDIGLYLRIAPWHDAQLRKDFADVMEITQQAEANEWKNFQAAETSLLATVQQLITTHMASGSLAMQQGIADLQSCAAMVELDDLGYILEGTAQFKKGSPTARTLQMHKPGRMDRLRQLPPGQVAYGAFHGDLGQVFKSTLQRMSAIASDKQTPLSHWRGMLDELSQLKFGTVAGSIGAGDPVQGALRINAILEVDRPDQLAGIWKRLWERDTGMQLSQTVLRSRWDAESERVGAALVNVGSFVLAATPPKVVPADKEAGERSPPAGVVLASAEAPALAAQEELRDTQKLLDLLGGPAGLEVRTASLSNTCLLCVGGGREAVADAMQRMSRQNVSTVTGNPEASRTLGKLWPEANAVVLFDCPAFNFHLANCLMAQTANISLIDVLRMKISRPATSYLGMAIRCEPEHARGRIYFPIQQISGNLGATMLPNVSESPDEDEEPLVKFDILGE